MLRLTGTEPRCFDAIIGLMISFHCDKTAENRNKEYLNDKFGRFNVRYIRQQRDIDNDSVFMIAIK